MTSSWRISSACCSGNCVAARAHDGRVQVAHTSRTDDPISVTAAVWGLFLDAVRRDTDEESDR